MNIKIFFTDDVYKTKTFEEMVNEWFLDHPDIKVKFTTQSECEENITLSIFYIEDVMKGGAEE